MAHRGRLNVLAHVLHRTYASILAEFEGRPASEVAEELPEGGFGDVKYHHGAHSTREMSVPIIGDDGIERLEKRTIALSLMPNPSHLEFVNPVVAGKVRALQTDHSRSLAPLDRSAALSITIHGDAAFPGQGIVAETLNLQSLDGYSVGGTLHLIANNQVGFTTDPERRALDAALVRPRQGLRHPDHPRQRRRHRGVPHRDTPRDGVPRAVRARRADRPRRLSPLGPQRGRRARLHPAAAVRAHRRAPTGRRAVRGPADRREGVVTEDDVAEIRSRVRARVAEAHAAVRAGTEEHTREGWKKKPRDLPDRPPPDAAELHRAQRDAAGRPRGVHRPPEARDASSSAAAPPSSTAGIDWGHAEALAFGSLLRDGVPIRLTGQDSERGTFAHRHAVLHDVRHGRDVHAHAAPAGRAGELRGAQLAALRERVPRVRVRLLDHRARRAGDLGGAVRRLRERRAGDHRPVHRVRPLEVGPDVPARAVPAARLRGQRARAQLGAARALPAARRR